LESLISELLKLGSSGIVGAMGVYLFIEIKKFTKEREEVLVKTHENEKKSIKEVLDSQEKRLYENKEQFQEVRESIIGLVKSNQIVIDKNTESFNRLSSIQDKSLMMLEQIEKSQGLIFQQFLDLTKRRK
jgi:hypothetical protein